MRSPARLKLAESIRSGLSEFAERWVRFVTTNELIPDTDEPIDEVVNRARLGFEVLANLLEDAEYKAYENVIRRLLHDWINRAGAFADLIELERAFPIFITGQLGIEAETPEAEDIRATIDEFLHSDLRPQLLADYLNVYEDIISTESRHTAYVLEHFDAILALTGHLNAADTRDEILDGLIPTLRELFDNVAGIAVWVETSSGLSAWSVNVEDEDVPAAMIEQEIPNRLDEFYVVGEVRRIGADDFPAEFRNLLVDYHVGTEMSGCVIPIRPKETEGALVLMAISQDHANTLELSLARVASAECALALERAAGRAQVAHVSRRIKDILSLSRETAWGTGYREAADMIVDHLLDLTAGHRALLLATPPTGSGQLAPVAWREVESDVLTHYRRASKLHPLLSHAVNSGRVHLLPADRLESVLAGRECPEGFKPSEREALGILPLDRRGLRLGVCIFLCPRQFAGEAESRNILAVFASTAADSLATAREYERNLASARVAELDAERARAFQEQITPQFCRNGKIVFWAHIEPAENLAGDIIVVRKHDVGRMAIWGADVAGRGLAAGWSMMFLRQLLAELPADASAPAKELADINRRLYEIECGGPPGELFATGIGLTFDETHKSARLARAGAPRVYLVTQEGQISKWEPDGLPLGLFPDAQLEEQKIPFKPGDKIVWVSDGLLGAENDAGDHWGESRLMECLEAASFLPARGLYERILAAQGDFGAIDNPDDDRSLFVVGFDIVPTWEKSRPGGERDRLLDEALAYLGKQKLADADFSALRSLLDEGIKNANEHGNKQNPKGQIQIKITVAPKYVHIMVRDEGGRLNQRVTCVPLRPDTILEEKGRGFLLMRHFSDHLWVEDDRGELNAIRLREGD
jgi:serine phosphatase RsbU (regulator of sigma subunit)/anti-sigma regulatory factor (Ser/Thr protein kinase)